MAETMLTALLIFLLVMSVYHDYTSQKIPNKITFPAFLSGVLLSTIFFGIQGFMNSVVGFLVGFLVLLLPFILGGMGAGDVKLMAAIGAIKGAQFVLMTFIYTAIVGGVIAILYSVYKRGFVISFKLFSGFILAPVLRFFYRTTGQKKLIKWYGDIKKNEMNSDKIYIPYAIPISIGALLVFTNWIPYLIG